MNVVVKLVEAEKIRHQRYDLIKYKVVEKLRRIQKLQI